MDNRPLVPAPEIEIWLSWLETDTSLVELSWLINEIRCVVLTVVVIVTVVIVLVIVAVVIVLVAVAVILLIIVIVVIVK
jgi:hypothetical protein